jgi:hypothetical protein
LKVRDEAGPASHNDRIRVLNISLSTADRDWLFARTRLHTAMSADHCKEKQTSVASIKEKQNEPDVFRNTTAHEVTVRMRRARQPRAGLFAHGVR